MPFTRRVAADGLLNGAGQALEDRLSMRWCVSLEIERLDVQRQARLLREGAEELDRELRGKIARLEPVQVEALRRAKNEERPRA